jgi:hypothetical protein
MQIPNRILLNKNTINAAGVICLQMVFFNFTDFLLNIVNKEGLFFFIFYLLF